MLGRPRHARLPRILCADHGQRAGGNAQLVDQDGDELDGADDQGYGTDRPVMVMLY
jgi:hypothetical protein